MPVKRNSLLRDQFDLFFSLTLDKNLAPRLFYGGAGGGGDNTCYLREDLCRAVLLSSHQLNSVKSNLSTVRGFAGVIVGDNKFTPVSMPAEIVSA